MARKYAGKALTSLSYHLDEVWMREAYRRLKRSSAPGVDGQTVQMYGENLDANLPALLEQVKSGRYRAPYVKRAYIPKSTTEQRPIGMPTVENKLLERAVVMLLEPIYEQDFLDCSYGFRPGRSAHQALKRLREVIVEMNGGYVLDVDVRQYFDTIPHGQLRDIVANRIRDGVITRLIGKWLKAGIWEAGHVTYPDAGSPQGGVISPMLSNIYLHEVLDTWFEQQIQPKLNGKAELIRFADDFVIICKERTDAEALLKLTQQRFESYGLKIHPEKTRIADFRDPYKTGKQAETFDFLGFTHYWGRTKRGGWAVKSKTSAKKFRASVQKIGKWCKRHRHMKVQSQHRELCAKVRGHYAYYGIRGNFEDLKRFQRAVRRKWHHWLVRRSRERHNKAAIWTLIDEHLPLPPPRIVHHYSRYAQHEMTLS